jgi:uncharacterized protein (TIGR00251 family)
VPVWVKDVPGGADLLVLVQPRSSRATVLGEHDGRLKIALTAPPVDGEANAALVEFVSKIIGLKKSAVELVDGATGRRKRLRLSGVSAAQVEAALAG